MCEIDLYRKTKIDIPMLAAGMILCILSCLMISVGIARVREDVWIAGILVAIVGVPLFLFSLVVFCVIRTNNYIEVYPKQYVLGKLPPPTFTSIPSTIGPLYRSQTLLKV
ncbi:unnamed protein product [Trichobilharzia regenti]|uniref:Transmembrane protein 230 n=1 Tax=Trichobilharzia regenti TaxID=157069 RepID=A0A183X5Q7_TRIRE|nr:unnamed protein product [Trichobilharzia regenti]VDQ15590.1 unnamed protein product [Trichobilharzia regenti]